MFFPYQNYFATQGSTVNTICDIENQDSYNDLGFATRFNTDSGYVAHNKGWWGTSLLGISEDCYGLAICFVGTENATIRRSLADVIIDPAAGIGGTGSGTRGNWITVIANLYAAYSSVGCGGFWYYFPLYLKAGTAIGLDFQLNVSGVRENYAGMRVYGKPSRPEAVKVGTKCETFGAVTASTSGTAITPGTNAKGSYTASLGTTANALWWWQCSIGYNDSTIGGGSASVHEATFLDVAYSTDGGTTKVIVAQDIMATFTPTEQGGKSSFGSMIPTCQVPAGATIYMRAASTVAPNTTPTVIAYGLGG